MQRRRLHGTAVRTQQRHGCRDAAARDRQRMGGTHTHARPGTVRLHDPLARSPASSEPPQKRVMTKKSGAVSVPNSAAVRLQRQLPGWVGASKCGQTTASGASNSMAHLGCPNAHALPLR